MTPTLTYDRERLIRLLGERDIGYPRHPALTDRTLRDMDPDGPDALIVVRDAIRTTVGEGVDHYIGGRRAVLDADFDTGSDLEVLDASCLVPRLSAGRFGIEAPAVYDPRDVDAGSGIVALMDAMCGWLQVAVDAAAEALAEH